MIWETLTFTQRLILLKKLVSRGTSGQLYTYSGNLPATITAVAHAIASLTRYGKVEQRNLPKGFTELDYIQGSGSQYIDTVISMVDSDTIIIDGCVTAEGSQFLFSQGASSDSQAFQLANTVTGLVFDIQNYTPYRVSTGIDAYNVMRHIEIVNREIFVDGVSRGTSEGSVTVPTSTARLFCNASGVCYYTRMRRFAVAGKIDLRAARRNSDNVVGMYDKVSGRFFTNAGTGSFTAGDVATPSPEHSMDLWTNNGPIKVRRQSGSPLMYQAVEWLKPNNGVTITGFKTKSTQEITAVFYRESTAAAYVYWSDTSSSGTTNTTAYITNYGNWRWDGRATAATADIQTKTTSVQSAEGIFFNGEERGSYTNPGEFVSNNDLNVSSQNNTSIRIYSLTVREGETVTLDLVPKQRITDGVYGFYDKVSGNFYTNDEATFEAGPVVDDPVEIYTDGEDEVLTVSGENLFDASSYTEINAYVNANTGVLTAGSSGSNTQYCAVIPCKPNTLYNITGQGASAWGAFTSDSIGTTATAFTKGGNLTTGANDRYLIGLVRANGDSIDYRSTLVVQEPQTVTVPMLLGVGDYKDAAELIQGIKTGKVGIKVFDGTEDFTVSSSGAMITTIPDVAIGAPNTPLNTRFDLETSPTSIAAGTQRFGASGTQIYSTNYYMKHQTITTAPDFKVWLASLFAAGTPDILVYPRATETTEQITANNLVTHKGVNTVDSTANVTPAEAKIEYYGTEVQMLGMMMPAPSAPEEPAEEPEQSEPVEESEER